MMLALLCIDSLANLAVIAWLCVVNRGLRAELNLWHDAYQARQLGEKQ